MKGNGSGRGPAAGRRGQLANEDALRALGEEVHGQPAPRRVGPVANEEGLRALGEQMQRSERMPVANEAGLLALGEQIQRGHQSAAQSLSGAAPVGAVNGAAAAQGLGGTTSVVGGDGAPSSLVESPPSSEPGDPSPRPEAAPPPGTGGRARRRHARARRKRVWLRRGVVIGLCVIVLVVGGGAGYLYYLTHDLNRIHVRGLEGALTSGKEAGTENILMVGSTSRCSLTVQNPAYGLCSQGVNGVNSDVIMILHADPAHHRLALMSIPRDLFIPNARKEGPNKIDAGLFEGVSQVVASVEEDFGIPIQHTVTLDFDQFANVVDALGGINMAFPMSVFDAESGLNVQAATCVHLNGTQALSVVRARHLQYRSASTVSADAFYWPQENLSDLARIRRDHEFLRVLAQAAAHRGLGNPITDIGLINSVKADLTFDQDWAVTDMANLVLDFHATNVNGVPQLTLPVSVVTDPDGAGGGLIYKGAGFGDSEFTSEAQDLATIDQVLGIDAGTDSMTGTPLPSPSSVNLSVVNGSGATNQATTTAAALGALGFHTVGVGDQTPVGDVAETVVYYGSRSAATEAAAEAVTRSMTGAVIMAYDPTQVTAGAQVTVVTGTDFAVNPPPPPPSTTVAGSAHASASSAAPAPTATAPTTTPTTAPTSSNGAIQPPSPPSTTLEPWDPRACPAGATPTAPVANET